MTKLLYVHGLSSSGLSATAKNLRLLLPECDVIAPDLPVNPDEAYGLLKDLCAKECPELIIGTSMGGMFAQQLRGYRKILVNPAFHVSEFMRRQIGTHEFLNPRQDGETHYEITPELCDAYRRLEEHQLPQSRTPIERIPMHCLAETIHWSAVMKNTACITSTLNGLRESIGWIIK